MSIENKKSRIGRYIPYSVGGETYHAYMPRALPPNPPLNLEEIYPLLDRANLILGKLDGMGFFLPNPSFFIYMYVRKEAVFSSQIEGTQSSLSDLLMYENDHLPRTPLEDVCEVSSYVAAMEYGLKRLESFPLSLRLLREIHQKLMSNTRGQNKNPGDFRTSQNWIGGSRPGNALFVPVPPERLLEALGDLENFFHKKQIKLPTLVKAALAHVQFETIHPFLDGNGRLGRLLITFLLCSEGVLETPILYLSLYFKNNRKKYYDHLQSVRETGDWESWIIFFLKGVIETATQATFMIYDSVRLFEQDRLSLEDYGKSTLGLKKIHAYLQKHPIANTKNISQGCGMSLPAVLRNLQIMEKNKIVEEITGKERNKIFVYKKYLKILDEGTTPP